jgi:NADH-quinone oxidoreductase subunit M
MLKRIFFGKIPEEMAHVKEASPHITITMMVFAALTLTIGILPDTFLNPITGYIQGMFVGHENVLPLPQHSATVTPVAVEHQSGSLTANQPVVAQASVNNGGAKP